jgi:hypothetical protein
MPLWYLGLANIGGYGGGKGIFIEWVVGSNPMKVNANLLPTPPVKIPMQKRFLFTALLKDDESTLTGKIFLFGLDEFVFEGLPEDGIYFSLKKENGK